MRTSQRAHQGAILHHFKGTLMTLYFAAHRVARIIVWNLILADFNLAFFRATRSAGRFILATLF